MKMPIRIEFLSVFFVHGKILLLFNTDNHVFTYICYNMKFYDKYPKLKEKGFLSKVLTDTIFSTMSLEDQQVAKSRVNEMVITRLNEQESKGNQFFIN